jgi:catechol 2,3-dioxygenase-like lactoylglutathione lyase family enzyme
MTESTSTAAVPARVSLVTLGVADVARSTAFYQALGWRLSASSVPGEVSFFHTAGGLLAVWRTAELAGDAGVPADPPSGFRGVSLAINVDGPADVDAGMAAAVAAGGTITRPAAKTDWGGYTGYFADPDGHVWEIAHNPFWPIGDDERPRLP